MPRLDRAREIFNSTTLFELSPVAGAKKIHELADDLYYASENLFKTIDEEFSEEKKKKTSIKQEDFTNRDLKLKDFRRQLDEFLAGLDPKEKKYATLFKYGNKIGTLLDEEVKANEKLLQDFLDKKLKPDAPEEEADSRAFSRKQEVDSSDVNSDEDEKEDEIEDDAAEVFVKYNKETGERYILDDEGNKIVVQLESDGKTFKEKFDTEDSFESEEEYVDRFDKARSHVDNLDKKEQLTGSSEYTHILKEYRRIIKREEELELTYNVNLEASGNGTDGRRKIYKAEHELLLKQKKDLLVDMDHYIERKTTEKNVALSQHRKENRNSKGRRETMESARKFLHDDIAKTEKADGIKKDELLENIILNMEYGNRLTKGKKRYDGIIVKLKELRDETKEHAPRTDQDYKEIIKKETELINEMHRYLNGKVNDLKGKNGYEFSLSNGEDGKRAPKNNTEKRYKIVLESFTALCNRVLKHVAEHKTDQLDQYKEQMELANKKYKININTSLEVAKGQAKQNSGMMI